MIEEAVRLKLHKFDEIDSLVSGLEYMERNNPSELFFYHHPRPEEQYTRLLTNTKTPYSSSSGSSEVFPFLLVNIGSGVSILSVRGPNQYKRVSTSVVNLISVVTSDAAAIQHGPCSS